MPLSHSTRTPPGIGQAGGRLKWLPRSNSERVIGWAASPSLSSAAKSRDSFSGCGRDRRERQYPCTGGQPGDPSRLSAK